MSNERRFVVVFVITSAALALLYAVLNTAVDPYLYWRDEAEISRHRSAYVLNRSLFKMVRIERALAEGRYPPDRPINLIIGDSTTNQLADDELSAITGETWINMSYGGASLAEDVRALAHLMDRLTIRRIVWAMPQRRFIAGGTNEMERSIWFAARPWAHAMTLESGVASVHTLRELSGAEPVDDPRIGLERPLMTAYLVERTIRTISSARLPDEEVAAIEEIEAAARSRGIRIDFVMMPVMREFRVRLDAVLSPQRDAWRRFLAERCTIDMSADPDAWPDAWFQDPLHLWVEPRARLTPAFAAALGAPCRRGATGAADQPRPRAPAGDLTAAAGGS